MPDHCVACGAPSQPGAEYCLECDIELYESFAQAAEYTGDRPDDAVERTAQGHFPHVNQLELF
jgi:hypothetical protein